MTMLTLPENHYGPEYELVGTLMGVDLGKHQDKTQLVVVLRIWNRVTEQEHLLIYDVVPLIRMTYETQAAHIMHIAQHPSLPQPVVIVFDRGGAGTAVWEMLLRELRHATVGKIQLEPLQLVNTLEPHRAEDGRTISVSHNDLLKAAQVWAESDRLHILHSLNARKLRDELLNLRVMITPTGITHIEGAKGRHDDAAFSAMYALFYPTFRRYGHKGLYVWRPA